MVEEFEDVEAAAFGGMAGGCDVGEPLGARVKRDDSSVCGKSSELWGEDCGGHHPTGDEDEGFVTGSGFPEVESHTIGRFEGAAFGRCSGGGEGEGGGGKGETPDVLQVGASAERGSHGWGLKLRERGLRFEGTRSIRFPIFGVLWMRRTVGDLWMESTQCLEHLRHL